MRRRGSGGMIAGIVVVAGVVFMKVMSATGQGALPVTFPPVDGALVMVDSVTRTVDVKRSDGSIDAFAIAPSTEIIVDGRLGSLDELRLGENVKLHQEQSGGRLVVAQVEVDARPSPRRDGAEAAVRAQPGASLASLRQDLSGAEGHPTAVSDPSVVEDLEAVAVVSGADATRRP